MQTVQIDDDFDPKKIQKSGQCFRVASNESGVYRFLAGEDLLYLKAATGKDKRKFLISCKEDKWNAHWRDYFDLNRSYQEIRKRNSGIHEFSDQAIKAGRGLRILRQNPWEMLITFIISQRKNMPAIARSVEMLCSKYGQPIEDTPCDFVKEDDAFTDLNEALLDDQLYAFPSPESLAHASEDDLRACSLGYRTPYILETARMVACGELDLEQLKNLPDNELIDALKCARGVGDKVANCISLFGYNRTSHAPIDVWIARAIDEHYNGENPFPKYGKDAGIIQQYIFYYMTH